MQNQYMVRESTVEDYLVSRVAETGGFTRKLQWIGRRGAPDRLCGWPLEPFGVHALVELKRPKGPTAEAHQKREHKRLRAIGFKVYICHDKVDVDRFILEMTTR